MNNLLKIINYLGKHKGESFTMLNLSQLSKIPYATFYRTLIGMTGLIKTETIGSSKVITLNAEYSEIRSYLTISSDEEKKEFLKTQPIIKKIVNELNTKDIVILFGSYAKKEETEKSDIDLLIINKDGKKTLSFSKYELLFKKKINPIFVTEKEFRLMLNEKDENLGKQALKGHIVLNNPELFWGLIY